MPSHSQDANGQLPIHEFEGSRALAFDRLSYGRHWERLLSPELSRFRDWTSRYKRAASLEERAALQAEGVILARARRVEMRALIERDPERALRVTVPASVRELMPPAVREELESRISGTGEYAIVERLPRPGSGERESSRREVFLNGQSYAAHVYGRRKAQLTEEGASLHGIVVDGHLALHESPLRVLDPHERPARPSQPSDPFAGAAIAASPAEDASETSSGPILVEAHGRFWRVASLTELRALERRLIEAEDAPGPRVAPLGAWPTLDDDTDLSPLAETAWTTGPKTVLVLRVDFSDVPGEPVSQQAALQNINNQVAPYYDAVSYGKTSLTPTVSARVYRMPQTAAYYATDDLVTALHEDAKAAAEADYIASDHDFVMVAFNNIGPSRIPGSQFNFDGVASRGGSRSLINGAFAFALVSHELGHNFGLQHANLWQVTDGNPVSTGGTSAEYGDPFDVMGSGPRDSRPHFNHSFKNRLGWLPDSSVVDVTGSGTYRVHRFDARDAPLDQAMALRIFRDGARNYWLGFRRAFPTISSLADGAYVVWSFNGDAPTVLIDAGTPGSNALDAGLRLNSAITDPAYGLEIRPVGRGGVAPNEYLDVEISYQGLRHSVVAAWGLDTMTDVTMGLVDVVGIAAGSEHGLALKRDGTVVAWGDDAHGQSSVPAGLDGVAGVSAGGHASGAWKADGSVVLWGDGSYGQTTLPPGLGGVRQLALGYDHVLALRNDGTVVGWGSNDYGAASIPTGLSGVVSIAAGRDTSLAVLADGTVEHWGFNWFPVPADLDDVTQVAAGSGFGIARRSDGTVAAWGFDYYGETSVPPGLTDVVAVAAGAAHAVALKSDGSVVAWGANYTEQTNVPAGIPPAVAIAGGDFATFALVRASGAPHVTEHPVSRSAIEGGTVTFSISATGVPSPAFRWQYQQDAWAPWTNLEDGGGFAGVHTPALVLSNVSVGQHATRFRCFVSNGAQPDGVSIPASLSVQPIVAPQFETHPLAQTTVAGGRVLLSAAASGSQPLTYQWFLDGVAIAGATGPEYTLPSAQIFHGGSYSVSVRSGSASVTSNSATLSISSAPASNARLMNLSTRALSLTGGNLLIPGFAVEGSGTKRLLVRAVGPTLASYGVLGVLPDPRLTIYSGSTVQLANDNWGSDPNASEIATIAGQVGAFPLDQGSADAAALVDLAAGVYTVVTEEVAGQTGVAIVELYDADGTATNAHLVNISTRGFVGLGDDIVISGFVVSNEGARTLLVRAVGPTLGDFNVSDVLADPRLTIYSGENAILSNDDWGTGASYWQTIDVTLQVGAFPLPYDSKDAAFVVTLVPGSYTVQASGADGGAGVALIEIYLVP